MAREEKERKEREIEKERMEKEEKEEKEEKWQKNPVTILPGVVLSDTVWTSLSDGTKKAIWEHLLASEMALQELLLPPWV
jgi:hypothetical protein